MRPPCTTIPSIPLPHAFRPSLSHSFPPTLVPVFHPTLGFPISSFPRIHHPAFLKLNLGRTCPKPAFTPSPQTFLPFPTIGPPFQPVVPTSPGHRSPRVQNQAGSPQRSGRVRPPTPAVSSHHPGVSGGPWDQPGSPPIATCPGPHPAGFQQILHSLPQAPATSGEAIILEQGEIGIPLTAGARTRTGGGAVMDMGGGREEPLIESITGSNDSAEQPKDGQRRGDHNHDGLTIDSRSRLVPERGPAGVQRSFHRHPEQRGGASRRGMEQTPRAFAEINLCFRFPASTGELRPAEHRECVGVTGVPAPGSCGRLGPSHAPQIFGDIASLVGPRRSALNPSQSP